MTSQFNSLFAKLCFLKMTFLLLRFVHSIFITKMSLGNIKFHHCGNEYAV